MNPSIVMRTTHSEKNSRGSRFGLPLLAAKGILAIVLLFAWTGGESAFAANPATLVQADEPAQRLQAGDTVKITFPGAPTLDTTQQIRRDGKLNLIAAGEVVAAGLTPLELEKQLSDIYATQLVSKEVKVTVLSSSFSVFVTGAVLRPGKLQPDHLLTPFEAIMEAGGFDYAKANTKAVRVIRNHGGKTESITIDLKAVLDGKPAELFYLEANDTVYVPEKFQWF